jgi:acetoin utilization deacetylase AcuC-like enzyme
MSTARTGTLFAQIRGTGLVYDDRYLDHVLPPTVRVPHPERPLRLQRINEIFAERGLDRELTPIPLSSDPLASIRRHPTPEHIESVRAIPVTGPVAELTVDGALGGVDAVAHGNMRNPFCAIRPPGHQVNNTGQEEGFCFYSNAAIAARYAQDVHGFEKIPIIDWDYHHGDGTQNAFYTDPSVLFFSAHDPFAYPGTGDPSLTGEGSGLNINAHLDCGSKDADMLRKGDTQLLHVVTRFRPDFLLLSSRFDSRRDDLLRCFDLTDDVFRRMTRMSIDLAGDYCGGRIVSLFEGA